ncbi:cytochrome c biogenesis protein CcsA [Candidatus Aquicultor secundus]|nr:cytochrome c biogenesis protein CcsA [Candidatus Aquicultor secundus]NCO65184.1 cytochrome c biogenesis protein CcsA [Solirubrobacter sp.]
MKKTVVTSRIWRVASSIMELNPGRRKTALLITFGLIILAIVLALVAPEEKTLGNYIRLIYIHAAVTWVGMAMFAISGLLSLFYFAGLITRSGPLAKKTTNVLHLSSASQSTAILFWTASVIMGSYAASLTWGGRWWTEPRLRVAVIILLMAIVAFILRLIVQSAPVRAGINLGLPVISVLLLTKTGKLVHPNNAFARSDSFQIKLFVGLITLVFIVVAINVTRLFIAGFKDKEARVYD